MQSQNQLNLRKCGVRCLPHAVRSGRKVVTQADLEENVEVVIAGYQKKNAIDQKVIAIIKAAHEKARSILENNRAKLDELSQYLYEKETITGEEFMAILEQ